MKKGLPDIVAERRRVLAELTELIASLSHEFVQPLSGISLTTQSLMYSLDNALQISDEELRSSLALMLEQVDHLSAYVNHVRNYCAGVCSGETETVDGRKIIERSLLLCATQLRNHGIEVKSCFYHAAVDIVVNPYAIEDGILLLTRLIRDAIKRKRGLQSDFPAVASFSVTLDDAKLNGLIEVGANVPWLPERDDSSSDDTIAWIDDVVRKYSGRVALRRDDAGWSYAALFLPLAFSADRSPQKR